MLVMFKETGSRLPL